MNQLDKIVELAMAAGVNLSTRSIFKDYCWDGKTIAMTENRFGEKSPTLLRSSSNIIHDIAHHMVAAKHRRKMKEFGLGSSPDPFVLRCGKVMSEENCRKEEAMASLLGIMIERRLGLKWGSTWVDHGWELSMTEADDLDGDEFIKLWKKKKTTSHNAFAYVNALIERGFLTEDLEPRIYADTA